MSSPEFLFKKRAVYTGLESFLSTSQLMQAMILWENKYAQEPKFAMRQFVADLCKRYGKNLAQSEVLGKLVRAMDAPEAQLLPDPSQEIDVYRRQFNIRTKIENRSLELKVFQLFLTELFDALDPDVQFEVKRNLTLGEFDEEISTSFRREFIFWMNGRSSQIEMPVVDVHQLRAMVNQAYVVICEAIGPVEADKVLSDTVYAVKRSNKVEGANNIVNKLI